MIKIQKIKIVTVLIYFTECKVIYFTGVTGFYYKSFTVLIYLVSHIIYK